MAVHPTCSARHLGLVGTMESLAGALADDVTVPLVATCCGMAGDRGLMHPELIEAATAAEAKEVTRGLVRRLRLRQPHLRDRAGAHHRPALRLADSAAGGVHPALRALDGGARTPAKKVASIVGYMSSEHGLGVQQLLQRDAVGHREGHPRDLLHRERGLHAELLSPPAVALGHPLL